MNKRLASIPLLLLAVCVSHAAGQINHWGNGGAVAVAKNAVTTELNAFPIQGITMAPFIQMGYQGNGLKSLLQRVTITGTNYVVLSNSSRIDLGTGTISDVYSNNGTSYNATARFADIGPSIVAAQAAGLRVALKPQIVYHNADGLPNPSFTIRDPDQFFANYKAYLLQWAQLAEQHNVQILCIGNEMNYATRQIYTPYWNDIIGSIRQIYKGKLTYSPLTPQYVGDPVNEVTQIQFWNKLDYGGLEPYGVFAVSDNPTVTMLNNAWAQAASGQSQSYYQLLSQLATFIGKPIIFSETGSPSVTGGARFGPNTGAAEGAPSNFNEQANWYRSFFETWALTPPAWLAGVFFWNNNPDPAQMTGPGPYLTNFNINGKPAEAIVATWFSGKTFPGPFQSSVSGTPKDDQIYLFGNPASNATPIGPLTTQAQTLSTTIEVTIIGTLMNGQAPIVHIFANGNDMGAFSLPNVPGFYTDPQGVPWTLTQVFTTPLPGLVNVDELKVVFSSAVTVGGPKNSQVFLSAASVNGIALTAATYTPVSGAPQSQVLNVSSSMFNGGFMTIDATPWNTALAARTTGTNRDPIRVKGGGGADTVFVLGMPSQYNIVGVGETYTLSESSGLDQNSVLTDIAQIAFQDGSVIAIAKPTFQPFTVAEFYNTNLNNYFITADANEAVAIDSGSAGPGWGRTGRTFKSGGNLAVCRFYGSQVPGPNSHFYTVSPAECQGLKDAQFPAGDPRRATVKSWNFESLDFLSTEPSLGACPVGKVPVYRAYNSGFSQNIDSNHRITSSPAAIKEVVARGWTDEGMVMCAPM
ncbi:MAG: hypothetical protein IPM02_26625 [Betaproteobacteria bacterium]|nr:hypothetical protein [Betaproteobacteria bacterium]